MINENKKFKNFDDNKKLYYIIGGSTLGILLIISILFMVFRNKKEDFEVIDTGRLSQENSVITEEASTSFDKTINEVENENTVNKIAINTNNMTNTNTSTSNKSSKKSSTNENTTDVDTVQQEKKEITFIRPVNGDIIKEYSKDNLIFSETLNEWTTHNGIDLRAEKTEIVKASAEGTVTAIKNDPRYGLSITIEHDDGYKTVYSNLLTSEFVVEGEKVEQGQTIATVGNTAVFESAEAIHLHFELLKDNENIDPTSLLK